MRQRTKKSFSIAIPILLVVAAFGLGAAPVAFNLTVDPYQVFWERNRSTQINDLAEKKHYPLWKLAKYRPGEHQTIILGDSRARALRDKYWHEAGEETALNLAYGGGTIPEIVSTFNEIKGDMHIRRLVIGIQLRSFDEDHKQGMNRVPEAVELLSNRFRYLKNWHVTKVSAEVFFAENPATANVIYSFMNQVSLDARAADLGNTGTTPLQTLLEPDVCFSCKLPTGLSPLPRVKFGSFRIGRYGNPLLDRGHMVGELHNPSDLVFYDQDMRIIRNGNEHILPGKHARQVRKNGASDWRNFEVSENYWDHLDQIGEWASQHGVELVFVIPPTITAMQKTIHSSGFSRANHAMRVRLARLGTVIDFDFPSALTKNPEYFTDAYHFNSKIARAITTQVVKLLQIYPVRKQRKSAFDIVCPGPGTHSSKSATFDEVLVKTGVACRVWSSKS